MAPRRETQQQGPPDGGEPQPVRIGTPSTHTGPEWDSSFTGTSTQGSRDAEEREQELETAQRYRETMQILLAQMQRQAPTGSSSPTEGETETTTAASDTMNLTLGLITMQMGLLGEMLEKM